MLYINNFFWTIFHCNKYRRPLGFHSAFWSPYFLSFSRFTWFKLFFVCCSNNICEIISYVMRKKWRWSRMRLRKSKNNRSLFIFLFSVIIDITMRFFYSFAFSTLKMWWDEAGWDGMGCMEWLNGCGDINNAVASFCPCRH